jgi:hypothetical protein
MIVIPKTGRDSVRDLRKLYLNLRASERCGVFVYPALSEAAPILSGKREVPLVTREALQNENKKMAEQMTPRGSQMITVHDHALMDLTRARLDCLFGTLQPRKLQAVLETSENHQNQKFEGCKIWTEQHTNCLSITEEKIYTR